MPKNKIIIALGALIALLPIFGFPPSWESFFQIAAGLSIVFLSVMISIDKKLMLRAKAQKRREQKALQEEAESHPARRVTDFYPKTGQPGRRATDIKWTTIEEDESSA